MKRQTVNPSLGAVTGGNKSLALTREVNLDTLSSDSSEEEIRDSGSSFHSLIVGAMIYIFHILENRSLPGGRINYINMYAPVSHWQVHAYCCHTGLSITTQGRRRFSKSGTTIERLRRSARAEGPSRGRAREREFTPSRKGGSRKFLNLTCL